MQTCVKFHGYEAFLEGIHKFALHIVVIYILLELFYSLLLHKQAEETMAYW